MIHKNSIFTMQDLCGKDFNHDQFVHCIFPKTGLRFINFLNCTFTMCDFSNCHFEIVSFVECAFSESKLSYVNFSGVYIQACDFSSALMSDCVFEQLKEGSTFEKKKIDLRDCKLNKTQLNGTVFILCDFRKVVFQEVNLEKAIFDKCNLIETSFSGCTIKQTNFDSSKLGKTLLDIEGFLEYGASKGFLLSSNTSFAV